MIDLGEKVARQILDAQEKAAIIKNVLERVGEDSVPNLLVAEIQRCFGPHAEPLVFDEILEELEGFGPIQPLLDDPAVSEILINDFDAIFFERDGVLASAASRFVSTVTYERFVKKVLLKIDKMADHRHPVADGNFEDGTRVHVVVPPLAKNSVVSFRRHGRSRWTLQDLHRRGFMTDATMIKLREILGLRKNILICGPTGAGKTTLLRAMIGEVDAAERIVTVEDTDEIGIDKHRGVRLLSRIVPDDLAPPVTLGDLLKHSLRMRPDRLVVGEIRGEEAIVFLDAISTGHRGSMSSIHAHSGRQALHRLESLASRGAPQWPVGAIRQMIYESVEVIIGVDRKKGARHVSEISNVAGLESFGILLESVHL